MEKYMTHENRKKRFKQNLHLSLCLATFWIEDQDHRCPIMNEQAEERFTGSHRLQKRSSKSIQFRIVGQLDFNASAQQDNVEAGLPAELSKGVTRMLFTKSDDPEKLESKPLARLPELNMDRPEVLEEFVTWGLKQFPADRYAVILWDHGGQWEGYGGDTQDGTNDSSGSMSPAQIHDAIQKAMAKNKVQKLDFLAFNTCLMGGVEVLDSFYGLCDFFLRVRKSITETVGIMKRHWAG